MKVPSVLTRFWDEFAASIDADKLPHLYDVCRFGDDPVTADELAGLVLRGIKRGTAPLLWSLEAHGKRAPMAGDLSIVTDWAGQPLCVIETERVAIRPFDQVDAEFAAIEGEADGSLAYWREVHADYYARECVRLGREPCESMPVVCEEFRVVFGG